MLSVLLLVGLDVINNGRLMPESESTLLQVAILQKQGVGLDLEILARGMRLLGIDLLGSIQNIVAASIPRSTATLGNYIKEHETFKDRHVSKVLKQAEKKYPLLGTALLNVFFPGSLRVDKNNVEAIAF
ncbi:hypothetical protein M406DRAFT_325599 [Cryphonectria parasitica EP155]|uniref:Uncharacterized protein n=1 Tax=Cryphonectria parasitica (strain ATCC 38755 / EP155) TaxID=660469 RepID=A0A9P4YAV9_CRYP1|nr:uncharacterized protein M406DRAFT_325599 [Cryphonectria parasitica EP155]KAF3770137.1 hypothetical protein M406DRAFT_325599 [Cryphonectria parasitica EP155]